MARPVTPKPCLLCQSDKPSAAVHNHHLREVAFGGDMDGQTVPLCASDHDRVHRLANAIEAGKTSLASLPTYPPWKQVLSVLLQQRAKFRQEGKPAKEARRMVSASLTAEELQMAHVVKKAGGFTSIEAMLRGLIIGAHKKIKYGQR